jgi:hypothetical protein
LLNIIVHRNASHRSKQTATVDSICSGVLLLISVANCLRLTAGDNNASQVLQAACSDGRLQQHRGMHAQCRYAGLYTPRSPAFNGICEFVTA